MIKFIENLSCDELDSIIAFAETSCLGTRALGPLLAYGTKYDFLNLWVQGEESLTAIITKFYGAVTVCTSKEADITEIKEFLEVIGYSGLSVDYGDGNKYVMKLERGLDCVVKNVNNCNLIVNSNYYEFYDIISRCHENYNLDDFENWFVDISHRVRHKTASTFMLEVDGKFVSTVAVLSITPNSIFLSAVSTLPEERGNRYAHSLIKSVCDKYPDRTVFLFCAEDKVPFYEKAGFINMSKIFVI